MSHRLCPRRVFATSAELNFELQKCVDLFQTCVEFFLSNWMVLHVDYFILYYYHANDERYLFSKKRYGPTTFPFSGAPWFDDLRVSRSVRNWHRTMTEWKLDGSLRWKQCHARGEGRLVEIENAKCDHSRTVHSPPWAGLHIQPQVNLWNVKMWEKEKCH